MARAKTVSGNPRGRLTERDRSVEGKRQMEVSKTFTRKQVEQSVRELDQLSADEYGIGLVELIEGHDAKLAPKRLRRLTGIVLKSKFADPGPPPSYSATGARRSWIWKNPETLKIVPQGNEVEYSILDQLRQYLPEYGASDGRDYLLATWNELQHEAEHETGLFKVLIMWTRDKIEKRQTKSLLEYLDTPVNRRLQALMDVADVVINAAIAPVYASIIPVSGLVVPITVIGLKYGYRQLMGPDKEQDASN
jgi:hypothetical protein